MKMKKNVFTICFIGLLISSCASVKILTPQGINTDIDGLPNLAYCQFFISRDVTLSFLSDTRPTYIQENTGTIVAERTIQRRSVRILKSTPGILQTKNNSGESLTGYIMSNRNGRQILTLYILFENDDDNVIGFTAFYDQANNRFELTTDEVIFDGMTFKVNYSGREMPYLKYKLLERRIEERDSRRAPGRTIGS